VDVAADVAAAAGEVPEAAMVEEGPPAVVVGRTLLGSAEVVAADPCWGPSGQKVMSRLTYKTSKTKISLDSR
jgi:hypothetical protein